MAHHEDDDSLEAWLGKLYSISRLNERHNRKLFQSERESIAKQGLRIREAGWRRGSRGLCLSVPSQRGELRLSGAGWAVEIM